MNAGSYLKGFLGNMSYETRMELGRLISDPIEQIFQTIIDFPKLYQDHGDPHVFNFLYNEKRFVIKEKKRLRAAEKILDILKVQNYLQEYRVFRTIVTAGRNLPDLFFKEKEGDGIEQSGARIYVAVTRLESDMELLLGFMSRIHDEIKAFLLRYSMKYDNPEATRELELLFDKVSNNFVLIQHVLQQLLESSLSSTIVMPEKDEITILEEHFRIITESFDRLEAFIQSIVFPFIESMPVRLLEGEGLHNIQDNLNTIAENALKVQQLALPQDK